MKKTPFFLWCLLVAFHTLSAQNLSSFQVKNDFYTRFQNFSTTNGLSSNSVLGIVQDNEGMMWFATMDGLNRFDGYNFKVYKNEPQNPNSLSDNFITCLEIDKYGNLWIGTQNGLNCFDCKKSTFIRYFHQDKVASISGNFIKSLFADENGYLWIETRSAACDRLNILKQQFVHIAHKPGEFEGDYYYHQIFEDSRKNIWIGGRCFMPFKIEKGNPDRVVGEIRVTGVSFQDINSYVETSDGKIIGCSYEKVLTVYDEKKNIFEKIEGLKLPGNPCKAIIDKKDRIWIGGYDGLQLVDLKKKTMTTFFNQSLNDFSIPSNMVYFVYKDRYENIWLGTNHGIGLYSEKWNFFRHYRQLFGNNKSLSSNHIQSLMQDNDGLIWIGTEENGVDTVYLKNELFGNIKYSILNQNIDEKTFLLERENLKDYFLRGLIKCTDKNRTSESIFKNYRTFKYAPLTFSTANENEVTTVYQDKKGKIYIGIYSNTGFDCYDKNTGQIKRYALRGINAPGTTTMYIQDPAGGNWFKQFLEDNQNRFWAVTWESLGLNLFDRNKGQFDGKHFFPTRNLRCGTVKLQLDSENKRLWMNQGSSIGYYDFNERKFHRIGPKLPHNYPNYDTHQRYYPYLRCDLINIPYDFSVSGFTLDDAGNIWLANTSELIKMKISDLKADIIYLPKNEKITSNDEIKSMIYVNNARTLYFASKNNFYSMPIKSCKVEKLDIKGAGKKLCLKEIEKNLWIGTEDGIWIFDTKNKTSRKIKDSFFRKNKSITYVYHIQKDKLGNVWIACKEGLIKFTDNKENQRFTFSNNELSGSLITDLFQDSKGLIWIGTNNGLGFINPVNGKLHHFFANPKNRYALINNNISAISEDNEHNLWISTDVGFCKYDRLTGKFMDYSVPDNDCISSRLGSCLIQDNKGNLWYGTTDKGLNKIDAETEKITHYMMHQWDDAGISSNNITCLYQDEFGEIWVGTDNGLNLYDENKNQFLHITTEEGLPDNCILAIKEDNKKNLWLSTTNGLCCYNPRTKTFRNFFRTHGIADNEFTGAACNLYNGELAFGSHNGFITFSPDSLIQKWKAAKVVLYDFKVRDKLFLNSLQNNEKIKLKYSENSFSVNFTSTDYAYAKSLNFRYKLQNFDSEWIYANMSSRTAKYTNLRWGSYKLIIENSNPFGEFNGKPVQIFIQIKTPWFVSWWFILLMLATFVFIIHKIIKYRGQKLQNENLRLENTVKKRTAELEETNEKLQVSEENLQKELDTKDKFFSIISHDLRNPSHSMSQVADLLYQNYERLNKTQIEVFLRMLSESAKSNYNLIEKLLYWAITQQQDFPAKPEVFDVCEIIENVKELLKPDAELKKINIKSTLCNSLYVFADKNMIETVLRNLISNAIKYSFEEGEVIISGEGKENFVEISVTDFGTGMEQNEVEKLFKIENKLKKRGTKGEQGTGLGLILCAEFVSKNNGKISAQSIKNQKTIITFTILNKLTAE